MPSLRLVVPFALCWCGSVAQLTGQSHRAELLKTDQRAAQLASDSGFTAALRQSLHRDAVLLWPEAPVLVGLSEVNDFFVARSRHAPLRLTWQPLEVELSSDSTTAALWGVAMLSPPTSTGPQGFGRFIAMWRREHSAWFISALVLIGINLSAPAPITPGVPLTRPPARFSQEADPFVAADRAFARLAQDSGAAVAFRTWADDKALIFGGGGLITRGPAAIGRTVDGSERWEWQPVFAGGAPSGDLGWTVGEAVIEGKDGTTSYSKYLTVWSRRGTAIRFLLDGGNARPPSP